MTAPAVAYLIVCAAPPARAIGELVALLQDNGHDVCVIATPNAMAWIDAAALAERTGHAVRHQHRKPDDPETLPPADAIVVVPATFNSLNKWTAGISDTFALGVLNEALGLGIPVIVAPYAKPALAAHPAFANSLRTLTEFGATVLPNEAIRTESTTFDWTPVVRAIQAVCQR